jgi:hypothetical protein
MGGPRKQFNRSGGKFTSVRYDASNFAKSSSSFARTSGGYVAGGGLISIEEANTISDT